MRKLFYSLCISLALSTAAVASNGLSLGPHIQNDSLGDQCIWFGLYWWCY